MPTPMARSPSRNYRRLSLKRTAERFTRLDRNGDGVISQADRNVKN